jgi:A/G-specific adenine glycosylase
MKNQIFNVKSLMNWYECNKRDFPWRRGRDPYAVWICEVMSQQTTLGVVLPYFEKFVAALPDVHALAQCEESRLRELWRGLGYYSRVRNLQKGAKHIVEVWNGRFPENYEGWLTVSGCGPYTAAVISSICFQEPVPCIDGNVLRVMARVQLHNTDVHTSQFHKFLKQELSTIIVTKNPGAFNQALMELGATVCTPRNPKCKICPIAENCKAHREGKTALYPRPKTRPNFLPVTLIGCVLRHEKSKDVVLVPRTVGFLKKTLGFPLIEACAERQVEWQESLKQNNLNCEIAPQICKHTITKHKMSIYCAEITYRNQTELKTLLNLCGVQTLPRECTVVPAVSISRNLATSLDSKIWSSIQPAHVH